MFFIELLSKRGTLIQRFSFEGTDLAAAVAEGRSRLAGRSFMEVAVDFRVSDEAGIILPSGAR